MTEKKYYKTPEEAQAAAQREYYRSGLTHSGRLGGPDCPPTYQGNARYYVQRIPEKQRKC